MGITSYVLLLWHSGFSKLTWILLQTGEVDSLTQMVNSQRQELLAAQTTAHVFLPCFSYPDTKADDPIGVE